MLTIEVLLITVVTIAQTVNCDESTNAAKLVAEPNIEGRFGYSGYARKNGYGFANNYYQPGVQISNEQNQKRFNQPMNTYGPQTFQNGQDNQNNPIGFNANGQNGYGGVTFGQGQGFDGTGNVGQFDQSGFGQGQFEPNLQTGMYQPNNFGHHVHRYGHHGHHHRPHGYGYGYYNNYDQGGKYGQGGFGQDNFDYDLQQDFVRFGQGFDNQGSSQQSYDSYDNSRYYWNK